MNNKFRIKLIENYQKNKTYKKLLFILRKLVVLIKKRIYRTNLYTQK